MILLAESGFLTKFACESTDCLSYIISLIDILTVMYLAYCASFRVNKGVRIFGWVWAALVIAATVTIVALHTCLFTLVSALFTALVLMALFGVTFEGIASKKEENADKKDEDNKPFVCPLMQCGCVMLQNRPAEPVAPAEPKQEEVVATVEEEPLTLKESLAMARETVNASAVVNKKYVADYLTKNYGMDVECNMRGNYTKTNLPLADTHYAVSQKGKKCFVYVYETEAAVVLLLCLNEKYADGIRSGGHRIIRSAFPKSKDAWYSIIVDDTYTEDLIQKILVDAYNMAK